MVAFLSYVSVGPFVRFAGEPVSLHVGGQTETLASAHRRARTSFYRLVTPGNSATGPGHS
jgi:hypothetical protein